MTDMNKQLEFKYVPQSETKFTCETVWGTMLFDSKAFPPFKTNVKYSAEVKV